MPSRVLIVSGLPASGKTTLAEALAARFSLPLVTKDDYKGIVVRHLPALPNAEAGPLSFALMWQVAEIELRAGRDFILETHFNRPRSEEMIRGLAVKHSAKLIQIFCDVPIPELQRRNDARVASGKRPGIDFPFDYSTLTPYFCSEPLELGAEVPLLRLATTREGANTEAAVWVEVRLKISL